VALALRAPAVRPAVNVGTGEPATVRRLAAEVLLRAGVRREPAVAPPRPHGFRHVRADASLAWRALGFAADVPLARGVADWLDGHGYDDIRQVQGLYLKAAGVRQ
jgi:nucleoside-diphosphate-sugar epimerase